MKLTLEVVSANGSSMGATRRKVFGPEGGSIGRSPEGDWMLPSPQKYISRHHATVFSNEAGFYIQAEGDKPVGINDPKALLPPSSPYLIRNGDRIYIDEYQILATVVAPPTVGQLFEGGPRDHQQLYISSLIPVDAVDLEGDSVDPLDFLGGGSGTVNKLPPLPPMTATSAIHDAMVFPPGPRVAPAPSMPIATPSIPNAIPSDWNITTFSTPESRPADEMPGEPVPPPRPLRAGPVRAPVPPEPQAPRISPEVRPELRPGGRPAMRRVPPAPGVPPAAGAPAAAPPQAVRQPEHPAAQQAPGAPGLDLGALLRAAGVDPSTVPPETADTLGKILRIAVQGTLDTLRARDEVKAQFRLAVTRVRQTENNPLSFAVDADDAINLLLNRRNPAYLPPVEAFERAFDDIRAHQVAMLVGLRAGVTSMMNRLDPKQLEEDFEKQAKRGRLLGASPRSKFWELYEAHFDQLRGDRDDAFRRLFGEEFARAYEQQIDALKTKRSVRKS